MFKSCLIANRGEIAVRIIRACNELGIKTIAIYSNADENAQHVLLADEAYPLDGLTPAESYLVIDKIIEIARTSGADCIHPGYGFLSESPDFARAVRNADIAFVGPSADAIDLMGVKTAARQLMDEAGVPTVPGFISDDASNIDAFLDAARKIGFPIMVKASGGGGGKGIRVVHNAEMLQDAIVSARREAEKAFGDPRIFLEKYIESARHIEVQVIADSHGNTVHLFERECSTQRRHQKIIEEAPSPILSDEQRQRIGETAVKAAQAVNYVNAGTVEFIATENGQFYFLEMNTRLQVEHPVTELITGLDIVQLQFLVASGEPLPMKQGDIEKTGHAIECRLYAEDPRNNFLPSIGRIHQFDMPHIMGVRLDSGIVSGDEVTIHYDPMIAKIIAFGSTRKVAISRMLEALKHLVILGVTTNLEFLVELLQSEEFQNAQVNTSFVDQHLQDLMPESNLTPEMLIASALFDALPKGIEINAESEGDVYSPWARNDGFKIG